MAKKKIAKIVRLQIAAGKANPAPPIGPALGSAGVAPALFCKEFNAKTADRMGDILPTIITVYQDKSFSFVTKEPPIAVLIKKELGISSGSKVPNRDKVGRLKRDQMLRILTAKRVDMRIHTEEAGLKVIAGTARSMGVEVEL